MPQWQSIYTRAGLADTGEYPRAVTAPASPDLVAHGTKKADDPSGLITEQAWGEYIGGQVEPDELNYLYVRGRNLSAKAVADARVRLYAVPASLVLWPAWKDSSGALHGWKHAALKTPGGEVTQYVDVRAQGLFVTPQPFALHPENRDYCLVGWVETDTTPNPVPEPADIVDVARYFRNHPDTSAFYAPAAAPAPRGEPAGWSRSLSFYQGAVAREMFFALTVENGRSGALVRLGSGAGIGPQPDPPVETSGRIERAKAQFSVLTRVPEHWQAELAVSYEPDHADPEVPTDLVVKLSAYAVVDDAEPAAEFALDAAALGLTRGARPAEERVVLVGAVRYPAEGLARPER
jgi:hypothetical protein